MEFLNSRYIYILLYLMISRFLIYIFECNETEIVKFTLSVSEQSISLRLFLNPRMETTVPWVNAL